VTDRVTMAMTSRTLLANLEAAAARLAQTQAKLSSGKELNVPSDDPYGVGRALQLRSELGEVQQYQRNVSDAQGWQQAMDSTLSSVNDYVLRARDLVVQGANGALGQSERNAIADEIDQITAAVKSTANARYAGQYLLSGTKTTTAPYSTADDAYSGNSASLHREIARGADISLSIDTKSVIGDGSGGIVAALRTISADLRAGSTDALGTTDLTALDTAHDRLVSAQSAVGSVASQLESAQTRLSQIEEVTTKQLSDVEDADMAKTYVDYSTQNAAYQAALKAGAQLIQPSLMDFLH